MLGLVAGAAATWMVAGGVDLPPTRAAPWAMVLAAASMYGWAAWVLVARVRRREREAARAADETQARLEQALWSSRRSEALYRAMAAHFPDGVIGLFGEDLRLVLLDGTSWMGRGAPGALAGRTLGEVLPREVATAVEPLCRGALRGEAGHREIHSGERDVVWIAHPVTDAQGQVILGLVTAQDVTERRALEARLAISSRLTALGTLVAGVAHEINNPLAAEMACHVMAMEDLREIREELLADRPVDRVRLAARLAEVTAMVGDAYCDGKRIARVVKDLMTMARPDPQRSRVRLEEVVDRALRWLPATVAQRAEVRVERGSAPDVTAAPAQIGQVLVNLVTNAALAMPPGRRGTITVRIGTAPQGSARLEVVDDGTGIDPRTMDRIFDPFFTTREVGQGMGLGLPICHAIVAAHAGTLEVRSTPGRGSRFQVELPGAPAAAG